MQLTEPLGIKYQQHSLGRGAQMALNQRKTPLGLCFGFNKEYGGSLPQILYFGGLCLVQVSVFGILEGSFY